jgi:hypothetical protein
MPALQGKVVLELKIAPSGQVKACRIVSSELKAETWRRSSWRASASSTSAPRTWT